MLPRRMLPFGTMLLLLFLILSFFQQPNMAQSVTPPGRCGSSETTTILEDINEARVNTRTLTPLILNQDLCDLAYDQALVIANNSFPVGSPLRRNDPSNPTGSSGVRDWVKTTSFKPYPRDDYAVDIRTFVTSTYNESSVMGYILSGRSGDVRPEFLLDVPWREIGIAQVISNPLSGGNYYNYVFIVGSQPNILPLIGYQPQISEHIAIKEFATPQVSLWLTDELYYTGADANTIGRINQIVISENLDEINRLTCPPQSTDGGDWQSYNLKAQYEVKGSIGSRMLYARVCDTLNRTAILQTDVYIMNSGTDTEAAFDFTASADNPRNIQFTDRSKGSIVAWEWDFNGDNSIDSTLQSPAIIYSAGGQFLVRLTVTSQGGVRSNTQRVITISEPPMPVPKQPVANISANPTSGQAPLTVDFSAEQSSGEITSYIWDFNGDGFGESNDAHSQARFDLPGQYMVILTVSGAGGTNQTFLTITVDSPPNNFELTVGAPSTFQTNIEQNFGAIISGIVAIIVALISGGYILNKRRGENTKSKVTSQRKVFISYRREVSAGYGQTLHDKLEAYGVEVFLDIHDIHGGKFSEYIKQHIMKSDCVVVILAPGTLESKWVIKEIKYAHYHKKMIIPILMNGFNLYGEEIGEDLKFLQDQNAIDLYPEFVDAAVEKIVKYVGGKENQ